MLMAILQEENANAEVEVKRDWSNLPIEIIGKVIRKLFWADRIRFRAVCKSWQLPLGRFLAPGEYPWLLSFVDEKKKRVIKLFNPYRNKNYIVEEFRGEEAKGLEGSPSASRYGWIMCSKKSTIPCNEGKDFIAYIVETFLFCPFTREHIEFPPMIFEEPKNVPWYCPLGSFFLNPASPEYVVCVVCRGKLHRVLLATMSPGDIIWRFLEFPLSGFMEFEPYAVTYLSGSFCIVSENLDVGVFTLANQEWKLLKAEGPMPRYCTDRRYYGDILHSDKDLLWYECKSKDGNGAYSCTSVADVWRFDFVKKSWIKKKKLGNRTVFSSQALSFSVGAAGKGSDLVGMVFSDDEFVSVNKEKNVPTEGSWSYADFYQWMVKEKKSKSKSIWNMWVDPRLVWKKSDLVEEGEDSSTSSI